MFNMKSSLRLYVISTLLLLGFAIVLIFSALSMNKFIEGMDMVMRGTMGEFANVENVADGQPQRVINFHIASRWQDLPEYIQDRFPTPPTADNFFLKDVEKKPFSPPGKATFVVFALNDQGQARYISRILHNRKMEPFFEEDGLDNVFFIIAAGFLGIALFSILLLLILRRLLSPSKQLLRWAKSLDPECLQVPPPNFHFKELNHLASIIHRSLNSVQSSLDREHEFLRNASHELRTPIAVVRANVDLFKKMNEKLPVSEKQNKVLGRIERAGLTMSDLTETLLWLSQDNSIPLTTDTLRLDELLHQLVDDLQYLLVGKTVEVKLHSEMYLLELPITACRIVLANIIRNAFQHTQSGFVYIEQVESNVIIRNVNDAQLDSNELGFGLGLKLTDKLVERFHWHYQTEIERAGHRVTVTFED